MPVGGVLVVVIKACMSALIPLGFSVCLNLIEHTPTSVLLHDLTCFLNKVSLSLPEAANSCLKDKNENAFQSTNFL